MAVKEILTEKAVSNMNRLFKSFTDVFQNNSDDYAFYRAEIFADELGDVHISWLLSDINGTFKIKNMVYKDDTGDIFYDNKFELKDSKQIAKAIHNLLVGIEKFPRDLSRIYFDVGTFKAGKMFMDPREPGSYILYLMSYMAGKDEPSFCITNGAVGNNSLTRDWRGINSVSE